MLRDVFSSRAFVGGLIFFVLIAAGTQLYSWHVRRGINADAARTQQFLQQLKTEKRTHAPHLQEETDITSAEQPASQVFSNRLPLTDTIDTEALSIDDEAPVHVDADLLLEEIPETVSQDLPLSPYGFGPYPEVPPDFPLEVDWTDKSAEMELLGRVMIKAWGEGERFVGGHIDFSTGKVYLNYPRTVYVREKDTIGHDGSVIGTNRVIKGAGDVAVPGHGEQFPPDVRVLDYDSEGIDPYTYLDLP